MVFEANWLFVQHLFLNKLPNAVYFMQQQKTQQLFKSFGITNLMIFAKKRELILQNRSLCSFSLRKTFDGIRSKTMKTPHLSDLFGTRPHDIAPSNDSGRNRKYLRAGFYLNSQSNATKDQWF